MTCFGVSIPRSELSQQPGNAGTHMVLTVKSPPANTGDVRDAGSIPCWGRSPGKEHGNPHLYGQRSPMGYSPWGHKESDTSDWACTHMSLLATELHVYWWFLKCTLQWMSTSEDQNPLGFCLSYGEARRQNSDQILVTQKQKWTGGFLSQNLPLSVAPDTGVKQRHPLEVWGHILFHCNNGEVRGTRISHFFWQKQNKTSKRSNGLFQNQQDDDGGKARRWWNKRAEAKDGCHHNSRSGREEPGGKRTAAL